MKKRIAWLLVMLLALSIFPAALAAEEPVTLTFWWAGSGTAAENYVNAVCKMVNEKYPWITVEGSVISWSDYTTKLNVAFAGGTSPDLFALGFNQLSANESKLLVLNDYLKEWDGWEDIEPSNLKYGQIGDNFYGFLYPELKLLLWRKDFFKEAGLDPNTPPASKEEMFEFAKKLSLYDGNGNLVRAGYEIASTNGDQGYFPLLMMHGLYDFWDENYDLTLNRPEALEAAKYANRFFAEKLTLYSEQWNVSGQLFTNGLSAMSLSISSASFSTIESTIGFENVGIAIPPSGKVLAAGSFVSISKDTKHADAAVKAWEVLSSKEAMLMIAKEVGFVPTRASAKDDYIAQNPDINSVVYEGLLNSSVYGVASPYFYLFRDDSLNPYLEEMYYGKITPEECLQKTLDTYAQLRAEADME